MKIQLLYDDSQDDNQDKSHDDEGHEGHLNTYLYFLSLTLEKKTSLTEPINISIMPHIYLPYHFNPYCELLPGQFSV